jgi:uncharacterized RDD family membrane protein YckC
MSNVSPGWYKDPAEPNTQRYWDGDGWVGSSLPLDATPPEGPLNAPLKGGDAAHLQGQPGWQLPHQGQSTGGPAGTPTPTPTGAPIIFPPGYGTPLPQPTSGQPTSGQPTSGQPAPDQPTSGQSTAGQPASGQQAPGLPGAVPPAGAYPPYHPGFGPGGQPPPNWPPYPGMPYPGSPYVLRPIPRPHGLALAPLGSRFLARVIDICAVLVLNVLINGWLVYQWIQETSGFWKTAWTAAQTKQPMPVMSTRGTTLMIVITILAVAIWIAYEVPFIANYGQTLGKRIMGVRVVPLEGLHRLGYPRALRRWLGLGLPAIFWVCNPFFIFVGLIFQFIDSISPVLNQPLHLALHDRSAGTIVVSAEPGDVEATASENRQGPDGGM